MLPRPFVQPHTTQSNEYIRVCVTEKRCALQLTHEAMSLTKMLTCHSNWNGEKSIYICARRENQALHILDMEYYTYAIHCCCPVTKTYCYWYCGLPLNVLGTLRGGWPNARVDRIKAEDTINKQGIQWIPCSNLEYFRFEKSHIAYYVILWFDPISLKKIIRGEHYSKGTGNERCTWRKSICLILPSV